MGQSTIARLGCGFVAAFALASCSGEPTGDASVSDGAAPAAHEGWTEATLANSWPVLMLDEANLNPFLANEGWTKLVGERKVDKATKMLGKSGGLAAARGHAEAAGIFRQTALVSGYSFIETYAATPFPTDPLGVAHLLTVSYAITGNIREAKAQSAKYLSTTGDDHPARVWHMPWAAWLDAGATWPPDLTALPMSLGEPTAGEWPEIPQSPHYALTEQDESKRERTMGDPGALVALVLWHEAAARAAAGDQANLVDVASGRYAMPVEPLVTDRTPLPPEFLFGSDYASPGDAPFLLDLMATADFSKLEEHVSSSVLAAAVNRSLVDGKLASEAAIDASAELRDAILEAAKAKFGKVESFDRQLADTASMGLVRNLALVAEATGDRETSGILRISAKDRSEGHTSDPVGLLAFAAWDASNRSPQRPADIIHQQSQRYTALEVARSAVDVLAIRVGRETTGQSGGM